MVRSLDFLLRTGKASEAWVSVGFGHAQACLATLCCGPASSQSERRPSLGRDLAPQEGAGPISLTPGRSPGYLREGESKVSGGGGSFLALPPFDTCPRPVDSQRVKLRSGELGRWKKLSH